MKENRLGPRQWAVVVVAGGAACALPFASRSSETKPDPVIDVAAALLPEATPIPTAVSATTVSQSSSESTQRAALPNWPGIPQSPFDELIQQKAVITPAEPTEEIVPMHPLRPWISAPDVSNSTDRTSPRDLARSPVQAIGHAAPGDGGTSSVFPSLNANTNSQLANSQPASQTAANRNHPLAKASPWDETTGDDASDGLPEQSQPEKAFVHSFGHGRRQLPVTAGPADQYTAEEIAAKLNLPKEEMVSALVSAESSPNLGPSLISPNKPEPSAMVSQPILSPVLPGAGPLSPPATLATAAPRSSAPRSSVTLSRQPISRPVGAQVRFGATPPQPTAHDDSVPGPAAAASTAPGSVGMVPLPKLPEERRHHVIFQPGRQ